MIRVTETRRKHMIEILSVKEPEEAKEREQQEERPEWQERMLQVFLAGH